MQKRMFGLETEYAVTGLVKKSAVGTEDLAQSILDTAREKLVHLPDAHSSGLYLTNGSRFYIDCGHHPEMATPECTDPWELVRYLKAGERILEDIGRTLESQNRKGAEILFFLCNVDYGGGRTTWGCHESYLCCGDLREFATHLVPHLVTRVVYAGAGGFNPVAPGAEFTLSPRAAHIVHVISGSSTQSRGIIHTKDESLSSDGYRRLHLICGESLCSELATWLKVGATALVVAMTERGLGPGNAVQLQDPIKALRTVSGDPRCRAELPMADGRTMRATDIQRHYLSQAETHLRESWMPPWGAEVCRRWRETLDGLDGGPQYARTRLDWAIKLAIYSGYADRAGFGWEKLIALNGVLPPLRAAMRRVGMEGHPLSPDLMLNPDNPLSGEVSDLTCSLRAQGMNWDELGRFFALRSELLEADVRFGQLGAKGIFRALDSAGTLDHRVEGVGDTAAAADVPPSDGRARLRGEIVRRAAGRGACRCDWQGIWDMQGERMLDLSDPFESCEKWKDLPVHRLGNRNTAARLPFPSFDNPPEEFL